jgi:hypothetical protein
MIKKYLILLLLLIIFSCSRKHHPQTTNASIKTAHAKKDAIPNTIIPEDKAAGKSVDGRLYFDYNGHRYWKNYNDGKYYLFNKSMFNNPAFKPH